MPTIESIASVATTTAPADDDCPPDRRTLEVAIEAYRAQHGVDPTSQDELVDDLMIRAPFRTYDVVDGTVVRIAGVPCDDLTDADVDASDDGASVPDVDEMVEMFDEVGADFGAPECGTEMANILIASMVFELREGREPDTLDELLADLDAPPVLWRDDPTNGLAPVAGTGCALPEEFIVDTTPDRCEAEQRTLVVASEAYQAKYAAPAADQQALVDGGLLRETVPDFTVTTGVVAPVPDTECAAVLGAAVEVEVPASDPESCRSNRRMLETAIDAFHERTGRWPESEVDLVAARLLSISFADFEIGADGEIVVLDGSTCG